MLTKYRPTWKMLVVLRDILAGRGTHHACAGMSQHGGRSRVLYALYRRGLIDLEYNVTEEGRKAVADANQRTD